ncbi:spindle assembly abnormal protein 6 homolog [Drosophila subpulchrella]|uniref:spindle assembly abnormal protein 6 homolog n=1 Tax=Drosophila subpulchrella TaxID=1486046 RepID=UPI0018A17E9B|nr:spindle assembly abnormal protein 6 homolog [Drosophila subpulchrella]
MWPPGSDDSYSGNMDYGKNVVNILPSVEMLVSFNGDMTRSNKRACLLYAERMDFKELLQLRLTEKSDQRRMYITTVDSASFQELKQDQSLNVTFSGFLDNVVRMLKDCQSGKLELHLSGRDQNISSGRETHDYHLQFVEIRSFKNLVHLSLPCRSAPLNTVLFYINKMLDASQKKQFMLEQSIQQMQVEINSQRLHTERLGTENKNLREAIAENTRMLEEKHAAEIQQYQDKLAKVNEQRGNELERNRRAISGLQAQMEKASLEKADLKSAQEQSEQRCQTLGEELSCCKSRVCTLKEQNDKLQGELANARKQERKLEYKIEDLKQHTVELQEHIQKGNKEKANLAAELEAEKKILHTKRQALEMASEEISKANQIILKQSQELLNHKKTIAWRTEVALQQEKAVQAKDSLLTLREDELREARITIEKLREEIPQQLQSMRNFAQGLEQKYSKQILILKERLSIPTGKENRR